MVNCNENGAKVYQPKKWNSAGTDMIQDFPLDLGAQDFKIDRAMAWDWSDWTVTARLVESRTKHMDLTLMNGSPILWVEPHGVTPTLSLCQALHHQNLNGWQDI